METVDRDHQDDSRPFSAPYQRFVFTAPLPPANVHQNARPATFWERNAAVQNYANRVAAAVHLTVGRRPWPKFDRAAISFEFILPDRRRRDLLNLVAAMKPAIDALTVPAGARRNSVGLGIIPDDDARHLSLGGATARVAGPGERPGVIVTLDALPADVQTKLPIE